MADEIFHPEEQVPESGVYQVQHYRHRLYHEVTMLRGTTFPVCSECGHNVRFRLVRTAPPIECDRNFATAKSQAAGSGGLGSGATSNTP
jgi:hypothetical protein